nr:DUF6088 family protein [Rhizobium rhizogenes]
MKRARAGGRGSVFTPSDFLDVAARAAVDQALSRLARNGKLRRLTRGLYAFSSGPVISWTWPRARPSTKRFLGWPGMESFGA